MDKIDIKITELQKQSSNDLQTSQLILQFKGNSIRPSVVNTLRRLSFNDVPTYALCKDSIIIEENTSIFDNDYMGARLEQFTIPNINVPVVILNNKYWIDVNYSDLERDKDPQDTLNLEMIINKRNNTSDMYNLTTNDIKLYQDGVDISDKLDKKYPLLILKLRTGEIFKCVAKGVLGKGLRNNIWAAAGMAYHDYEIPNDIKFTIESQGQLDEYDILYRSCQIIKEKMKDTKEMLQQTYETSDITNQQFLSINFDNEDHTFGEILNDFLQDNKDIAFSGLSKPDLLKNQILIRIKSIKNNPTKPLYETMDYVIEIYDEIEKQILKLGKKYIV
jgi:DNA-directed RNA polymerase subunit L